MTIAQMHDDVLLFLNRIDHTAYDGYESDEIDRFIIKAMSRKINSILSVERDELQLGFQGDQKRLDDIRTLIEPNVVIFSNQDLNPEAPYVFLPIPENYRNLVNLRVLMYDLTCGDIPDKKCLERPLSFSLRNRCIGTEVPARVVKQNKVFDIQRNPFTKSTNMSPLATINGENFQIFQDKSYIVSGVIADYVREPENVSLSLGVDCELAEHVHQEIVDLTVNHILEVTGNPRFQSSSQDITRSE